MEVQSVGGDFNGITRWREKWFGTSHRAHIEVNTASGVITFLNDPAYWVLLPQASAELLVHQAEDQPAGPKISIVVPLFNTRWTSSRSCWTRS